MDKLVERLRDATRSGVYRVSRAEETLDAGREAGHFVAQVQHAEKAALMKGIAGALGFPDWFGANWDALEDCLSDLSWRPASGYVLVFQEPKPGDELGVLVDVLRSSAESWAERAKPFFAVFVDPRGELELPELFRRA